MKGWLGWLIALGLGVGWFVTSRPDTKAIARVALLQHRADSLDQVAAHRDTVHITNLLRVRASTNTLLLRDTLLRSDTVRVLVAGERAACDTALAAKDSTIAETREVRHDAIVEADHLARRAPSRYAITVVWLAPETQRPVVITGTVRVTQVFGLDIRAGIGWRP